jgi:glucose-6-phosphate-specific signal transduction histidine kinase
MSEDKRVLRQLRDAIVDGIISLTRIVLFWIPGDDAERGKALMTLHPFIVIIPVALFFIMEKRNPWKLLIVAGAGVVAASQWIFRGCVVTRAEQKLTGSQTTIIDPFLSLCGVAVNRDTRIVSTVSIGTSLCIFLIWAAACDYLF